MKIRLAYGKTGLEVSLPDDWKADIVRPKQAEALADQAGAVREALRNPLGSRPLRELVQPSDAVGIVCNDITRPTPYQTILPVLLEELSHVPDERITLLIATGTHRADTPEELEAMFGTPLAGRFRIVQNDARAGGSLKAEGLGDGRMNRALCHPQAALEAATQAHALVGTTAGGNEVWIHKEYLRCDVRILTGFIEPHFFAGFSGGGKAVMPGLARLDTILRNHRAGNIDHPQAAACVADGNPVWEEIREAARMTAPTFLLNVALDGDKRITAVFAGALEPAHRRGRSFVTQHAGARVEAPYDIVLTSNCGYPLDQNLYQAVKGMSAAAGIVKKGGAIIVAAECCDGIPDHGEYKRLLWETGGPAALRQKIRAGACPCRDAWQAQIQARVCEKAEVYLFSDRLTDEQITRAWLKPCRDLAATVERLRRFRGGEASICLLPDGPQTVPCVSHAREE